MHYQRLSIGKKIYFVETRLSTRYGAQNSIYYFIRRRWRCLNAAIYSFALVADERIKSGMSLSIVSV